MSRGGVKILVLTHRLPYAPNRGDRIRAFHIVRRLALRADVHVVSLVHDRAEEAEARTLEQLGVRVSTIRVPRLRNLMRAVTRLGTTEPLTHLLLDAPAARGVLEGVVREGRPDVVLAYCSGFAPPALEPPLAGIPLIVDLVDIDSAKWAAYAETASPLRSWIYRREARCLSQFEARAARAAVATTVVNDREREALVRFCPDARVEVVPNGVDVESLRPLEMPAAKPHVVFSGVFNYAPNADGARWFAREVWPRVRAAVPRARLTLAGAHPNRAVRALAADRSIEVTGSVADMRPYLWRSAIAVAPIFQARGVQNKVLEAVAAGLPAVVTQAVWDGLPADVLPACRLAVDPDQFAGSVIELLFLTPGARRAITTRARLSGLAWPVRLERLLDIVESAAGPRDVMVPASVRSNHMSRLESPRDRADHLSVPSR